MNKVEKIKAEIERLQIELIQEKEKGYGSDADDACILELQNVLTYIDSLEKEPVSNDLEEAAIEAFKQIVDSDKNNFLEIFKAGAEWQKEKMLEDAVDGEIYFSLDYLQYRINTEPLAHLHHGDKVKLIIVKEE